MTIRMVDVCVSLNRSFNLTQTVDHYVSLNGIRRLVLRVDPALIFRQEVWEDVFNHSSSDIFRVIEVFFLKIV